MQFHLPFLLPSPPLCPFPQLGLGEAARLRKRLHWFVVATMSIFRLVNPCAMACELHACIRGCPFSLYAVGFGAHTRAIQARHVVRGLLSETVAAGLGFWV